MSTYPEFLVRIDCMTYNHAPYVEDAMNGFCMQQTTFPFVATIIDDASTDGEPEVIRRYLDAHFDLSEKGLSRQWETDDAYFIYAQHRENKNCYFAVVLLKYNFWQAKKSKSPLIEDWTKTKYVAFCEGDDYWISSSKIQKQIDFMEEHPDYGMVYTNHKQYVQADNKFVDGWSMGTNFADMLILGNKVCTLTVCVNNSLLKQYYSNEHIKKARIGKKWKMADYPIWLYLFANSKVKYIDEIMGVYRVLTNSASHFLSLNERISFMRSTYAIQECFATLYGYKMFKYELVRNNLRGLIADSDSYNQNLGIFVTPVFAKMLLYDFILYIDAISTHNRYIRELWRRMKFFLKL